MKRILLILISGLFISSVCGAQTSSMGGFRKSFATVMFAGLGGAILGLSTLSFYGKPQDNIGNIWTGLTLGAIGGGVYVAASSTTSERASEAYSILRNSRSTGKREINLVIPVLAMDF